MVSFFNLLMWISAFVAVGIGLALFIKPLGHKLFGWHYVNASSPYSSLVKRVERDGRTYYRAKCAYCGKIVESRWDYNRDDWTDWNEPEPETWK